MQDIAKVSGKYFKKFMEWVSPDTPQAATLPVQIARTIADRDSFTQLLNYKVVDGTNDLIYLDDGENLSVGFVLQINPLLSAGLDAESQLEAVINACPVDTIVQFGVMSTPQIQGFLDMWMDARLYANPGGLMELMARRRHQFMLDTATEFSMLPKTRMHPRVIEYYVSVRIPFSGDIEDREALKVFIKEVTDTRNAITGALQGAFIGSRCLNETDLKYFMKELLNPQMDPAERVNSVMEESTLAQELVDRTTRISVDYAGNIAFSSGNNQTEEEEVQAEVVVVPLTVDVYPKMVCLPMTAELLGAPDAWDDRITCPFWAYTTIHVLDADKARDQLVTKQGLLAKQTMSESAWYRSMMSHLFDRKASVDLLLTQVREGHRLVRAYTGINLYTHPSETKIMTESVKGLWRRAGFRASAEPYIGLPIFAASLPLQYSGDMDLPNKGLQRGQLMHSLNAASLAFVQGDWTGTHPAIKLREDGSVDKRGAGPLFVSRRGQLACFDLLQTKINFNFVIVAASGSGKSFLANEICVDFLSKGGLVRIIDVGKSYARFCEIMGGTNMVFTPENPVSINPFTGIDTMAQLDEMLPMMKMVIKQMAYPLKDDKDIPDWEFAAIEKAIKEAWLANREDCDMRHVYEWLLQHGDARAQDLAFQLEPYALGRYSRWFTGKRGVSFDNPLVIIELEQLKQDSELQAVVLTMIIHQVTKEMYLSDRALPKLLAIDEAWDLMGNMKTGKFIETAFRRARKYNGIAGVITQSFEDFEKSEASRAALDNAAWQFILFQREASLNFAMKQGRITGGEGLLKLLKTVRSGDGFSEVYIKGESGEGLYRFVTDRHTYYTFTTTATDTTRLDDLEAKGYTTAEAVHKLASADYTKMWGAYNE